MYVLLGRMADNARNILQVINNQRKCTAANILKKIKHMSHDLGTVTIFRLLGLGLGFGLGKGLGLGL
jgi:Fe2+ or Zn2+ uptake regulation protein